MLLSDELLVCFGCQRVALVEDSTDAMTTLLLMLDKGWRWLGNEPGFYCAECLRGVPAHRLNPVRMTAGVWVFST